MESVEAGTPAAAAGIRPGDIIVSLAGHPLHDVIDYQFHLEPGVQIIELERAGEQLQVELDNRSGGDPGIFFTSVIFDRIRTCSNRCVFCFVDQVPANLRPPLYLKDDDFRLSFLHGNFITLNNLGEKAIARIIGQRLSPLYVSVHATGAGVRERLMGCGAAAAAAGLANLKRLGEAGIELHAQVVYCPGLNSGGVLEQTITELSQEYPGVKSAGVVPVAAGEYFLKENPENGIRRVSAAECLEVIDRIAAWQKHFRQERGVGFVYAADEFYLKGGRPLPPAGYYDGFAQYENGIGIARSFLEEGETWIGETLRGLPLDEAGINAVPGHRNGSGVNGRVFLLTGTLAADLMAAACERFAESAGHELLPLVAENRLFGSHVTVTGLLGGHDIVRAARAAGLRRGDLLLIPASSLGSAGERFLDDLLVDELQEMLECSIEVVA